MKGRQLLPTPPWLLPHPNTKSTFIIVSFSERNIKKTKI